MGETCMLFEADPCMMAAADLQVDEPGGWIPDPHPCTEPPAATVTFACVHEHVDQPRACYGCVAEVQRAAGLLSCPRCDEGPEPHACICLVVIDWDSGEKNDRAGARTSVCGSCCPNAAATPGMRIAGRRTPVTCLIPQRR